MNRRFVGLAVVVALVIAGGCTVQVSGASRSYGARTPELIADESVATDLQAVADEVWAQFLVDFGARTACFGDLHLHAARDLGDRGAYDPLTATATVRVPGSAAMLQSALVHEWAHHVEFQCEAHRTLRPAFLRAQGLPVGTSWRLSSTPASASGPTWEEIPSEQYAEAVVELVLGSRQIPTAARVRVDAVNVVRDWAFGR